MYTLEKNNTCPLYMYTVFASASNNAPFYTHISLYMVKRIQPLDFECILINVGCGIFMDKFRGRNETYPMGS